jgi:redox-sensing transcriptional repressor
MEINQNKAPNVIRVIPEPTLRRLPVYHHYLKKVADQSEAAYISCTQIANDLNLVPDLVRKDLEVTEVLGKPKVGYNVLALMQSIENFLGWNNSSDAFLVGAGHLGTAILGYQGFKDYGLNIIAAFDVDPDKVGKEINGRQVFHISKLPKLVERMSIKIGILTAPARSAQEAADTMVSGGIKAIWNFAPTRISVPPHIIVQHENLASSLAVLLKKLSHALSEVI